MEKEKELIEELADLEHQQWSHWEKYREEKIDSLLKINNLKELLHQKKEWIRLRETDYKDLTEKEKESDREWARKVLPIIKKREIKIVEDIKELLRKELWDNTPDEISVAVSIEDLWEKIEELKKQ